MDTSGWFDGMRGFRLALDISLGPHLGYFYWQRSGIKLHHQQALTWKTFGRQNF